MASLVDSYQRKFRYLRLSITDSCNFRCSYCLPNGNCIDPALERPLNLDEIINLTTAFAGLGVEKVRITGGEPTLRRDVVDIISAISAVEGIDQVAISTNGYRLAQLAPRLAAAGCKAANISLDSLNPEKFAIVTGQKTNQAVLDGIDAALAEGLKVKVNAVLMKGINDEEMQNFLEYVKYSPVTIRFIELMRTGDNKAYFDKHHVRADVLSQELIDQGWDLLPRSTVGGPAEEYAHPDYKGRLGFIKPYAKNFCDGCNRLRISCRGELKLCLFGDGQESVRHLLQNPSQMEELQLTILQRLSTKKISHFLDDDNFGTTRQLASIGG
jgi:cyclic pyranopterin phosphate synthase